MNLVFKRTKSLPGKLVQIIAAPGEGCDSFLQNYLHHIQEFNSQMCFIRVHVHVFLQNKNIVHLKKKKVFYLFNVIISNNSVCYRVL